MKYVIAFHLISTAIVLILTNFAKEIDENEEICERLIKSSK